MAYWLLLFPKSMEKKLLSVIGEAEWTYESDRKVKYMKQILKCRSYSLLDIRNIKRVNDTFDP